jgi:hypothetical protein
MTLHGVAAKRVATCGPRQGPIEGSAVVFDGKRVEPGRKA